MKENQEISTPNRLILLYEMLAGKLQNAKNFVIIFTHKFTLKRFYTTLKDEHPNITITVRKKKKNLTS